MIRSDDPRLKSLFSNTGGNIKIGLIGFPSDVGTVRNGGRPGGAGGPDVVRTFLNKKGSVINPEYNISLENVEIKDFGDTPIHRDDLKETHRNHQLLVERVLNEGYIPIIVGGSNDQSFANFKALSKYHENTCLNHESSRILVINIDAHLDVRPLLPGNEPHSGSPFRQMLESDIAHSLDFVEFACQGSQCSLDHVDYVKAKGGQIIWLKNLHESLLESPCQNSKTVPKFIGLLKPEYSAIFVSFDIDSIRASDCPGVSCPATVGLTADEALSICFNAGKCPNVRMLDISEFNPLAESYLTGILVANMIYYFLMGVATRQR